MAVTISVGFAADSLAQNVWTGSGVTDDWADSANWVGGNVPASNSGTWLVLDPTTVLHSSASAPWELNRIDFTEYFYVSGSELSFSGPGPQINGTGEINNPIKIGAAGLSITSPLLRGVGLRGVISGVGPIIASNTFVDIWGNTNTYEGVVANLDATVSVRYEGGLGTAPVTVADNIILNGGRVEFLYTPSLNPTRRIVLNGTGAAVNTIRSYNLLNIPGEIRGIGALTVQGLVQLDSSSNSYTGGTVVLGGKVIGGLGSILSFTSLQTLGGTGANVTIQTNAALSPTYALDQSVLNRVNPLSTGAITLGADSAQPLNFQVAGLTGVRLGANLGAWTYSGDFTPSDGTFRLGGGEGRLIISSVLGGASGLNVSSDDNRRGRVELTAQNTFAGGTTVGSGGTLLVAASGTTGSGTVNVNSDGLFGGNGQANTVQVNSQGTLAPGIDGPGTLTTGNLIFRGGTLSLTLGGPTVDVGYDQVSVIGSVLLQTSPMLALTLTYDAAVGDSFTVIDNDETDNIVGRFAGLNEGARFFLANGKGAVLRPFSITYAGGTGNDIVIRATPEPGALLNILLVCGVVATRRFRGAQSRTAAGEATV